MGGRRLAATLAAGAAAVGVLVGGAALLTAVAASAAPARLAASGSLRSAQAAAVRADSPAMVVTPNWAGYVATAPSGSAPISFTSVTGTWTVPQANCTQGAGSALSTAWVGLGGYTTSRQEEVGTDTGCDAKGKPVYFAWFELVPYIAYHVKGLVEPGDTITGLVKVLGLALVQLQVENVTRGWTFTRNITFSPMDTSTADWIVESPATCVRWVCSESSLANFGSLNMTGISATTAGGETGTLNDPNWQAIPIQLIPGQMTIPTLDPEASAASRGSASSPAGATPGDPSSDGSSFSVTWVPKPTPPV